MSTRGRQVAKRIVVYGGGGHGKVVADIAFCLSLGIEGFVDDGLAPGTQVLGLPVLGGWRWLEGMAGEVAVALGIGKNSARSQVFRQCVNAGFEVVSLIHPSAAVARSAKVGAGSVIMANAAVNPDAVVGEGAIINTGAVVEHDCVVAEFAHLSPNAAMGGASSLGRNSQLGLGAVILPGVRVGEDSVVGAGAVVNRDLADRIVAVGVPARVRRSHEGRS